MKRDEKAKDSAWQGDAGWGATTKDRKFILVEEKIGSTKWIRVQRDNPRVRL